MTDADRQGFTLMELLIVLAIIMMIVSIGTPSVIQILDRSRFRSSVLELQAELGKTRTEAMKTGTALLFRYRQGTGEYQVIPKDLFDQISLPAGDTFSSGGSIPVFPTRMLTGNTLFMGGTVIETESFLIPSAGDSDSPSAGESIGTLSANPAAQKTNPSDQDQAFFNSIEPNTDPGWSSPILFFPNGKTSTAVIFIRSLPEPGKQNYYSEISFRGITGAARISTISVYPPGSPEFPSVLSPQAFERMNLQARGGRFGGTAETVNRGEP